MQNLYNYSNYLNFTIKREKTLINLDRDLLMKKLYLCQNITDKKRKKLEQLLEYELIEFGNYTSNIVYMPANKYRYLQIIGALGFCEYMEYIFTNEIKRLTNE